MNLTVLSYYCILHTNALDYEHLLSVSDKKSAVEKTAVDNL